MSTPDFEQYRSQNISDVLTLPAYLVKPLQQITDCVAEVVNDGASSCTTFSKSNSAILGIIRKENRLKQFGPIALGNIRDIHGQKPIHESHCTIQIRDS